MVNVPNEIQGDPIGKGPGWAGRKRLNNGKGSFKGIPFNCDDHEIETGRVWVAHEYPHRDLPYHEDMRKQTKRFTVNAYILAKPGSDYKSQLDALLAACESPGPGTLIHPFHGEFSGKIGQKPAVVCTSVQLKENAVREGGIARLTMTFEMTGTPPVAGVDYLFKSAEAEKSLFDEMSDWAKDHLNFDGPDFIEDGFLLDIAEFASDAQQVIGVIPELYRQSAVGQLFNQLQTLDATISGMIDTIPDVVDQIQDMITSITEFPVSTRSFASFNALMELVKFGDDDDPLVYQDPLEPIPSGTPSREQQSTNRETLFSLIRQTAISGAAGAALKIELTNREDAEYIRNTIGTAISKEMQRAG
ncbi:MAG: DNA circularization N-terminal domain-containing protein, partial [Planctomycetota bacterium]